MKEFYHVVIIVKRLSHSHEYDIRNALSGVVLRGNYLCQHFRRQKIPFETHIFPYGYHGLGLGTHPDFPEVRAWPDLAAVWMRKLGF